MLSSGSLTSRERPGKRCCGQLGTDPEFRADAGQRTGLVLTAAMGLWGMGRVLWIPIHGSVAGIERKAETWPSLKSWAAYGNEEATGRSKSLAWTWHRLHQCHLASAEYTEVTGRRRKRRGGWGASNVRAAPGLLIPGQVGDQEGS